MYQNLIMSLTLYTLEYNTYEYKEVIYVFYGRKQELKTLEKEYLKKNSLCSIYEARRIGKNEILGGIYYPIQNLIIDKSELGRSIEIDGIARDGDSLLVIECKFTNEKRSIRDYEKMVENTSIKMFEGIKNIIII